MTLKHVVILDAVWVKVGTGSAISGDIYGHPSIRDGVRAVTPVVSATAGGLFKAGQFIYNPIFIGETNQQERYENVCDNNDRTRYSAEP